MDWSLQAIRASRADPPGQAGAGARRRLYGAALQQFDELIVASQAAGYASRPLPLFYALSQAGRAVVAAYGSSGIISGHGLSEDRAIHGSEVLHRAVRRRRSTDDALTALCEALQVGDPFATVDGEALSIPLGAAWAAIPRWNEYLPEWHTGWAPAVRAFNKGGDGREHMERRVMDLQGSERCPQIADAFDPLSSRMYPQLPAVAWYTPTTRDRKLFQSSFLRLGAVRWEQDDDPRTTFDITRQDGAATERWLLPAAAGSNQPFEPLTSWWVLLFGLSILARYDPALWSATMKLDESTSAVPLALLLDEALLEVPRLIADALLSEPDPKARPRS